jgi:hypothetical protein
VNRQLRANLLFGLASLLVALLVFEFGLRLLVKPSEHAWGTLLGRELPPLRIVPGSEPPAYDPDRWHGGVVVDGRKISHGDQHGIFRPDPLLGFTYEANAVSTNGWWQSNNLGARSRAPTSRAVAPGTRRVLVFGESFAHGSRLPQEQAWPNLADAMDPGLEVLNFAVDGYSMGQSLLRFRQLRPRLEYDVAVLFFVPDADLWRDINVMRDLGERGWRLPIVLPRFVHEGGQLRLVPPPYPDPLDVYRENGDGISPALHEHLLRYDRYYIPARHGSPPIIGASIYYKLAVEFRSVLRSRRLRGTLMDPGGEALGVSRGIFSAMQAEAAADGASFVLAILPVDLKWREAPHLDAWRAMTSFVCTTDIVCVDLLDALQHVPYEEIDFAHDGAHYGSEMNRRIARAMHPALRRAGGDRLAD